MIPELGSNLHTFTVDLRSPIKEFEVDRFDKNARVVHLTTIPISASDKPRSELKYVVEADMMIVFIWTQEHKIGLQNLRAILRDLDVSGKLQSAGFITVTYTKDLQTTLSRAIYGASSSLPLDPRHSSNYRQTILKAKLGEYFRI